MSMRRNPVYVFKNKDSRGIYDIPLESMIQVIDSDGTGTPIFTQITGKNGIGPTSTIEDYLISNNYIALDKDTTYVVATDIADGLMSQADFVKLTNIPADAAAAQTKTQIDLLGIDAATVSGYFVKTSVPLNAIFTDTVYDDITIQGEVNSNTAGVLANTTDIATNDIDIATNAGNIAVNSGDIGTNATDIAANASKIALNVADIATNTAAIGTNATAIGTNTADIATNVTAIGTNTTDIAQNAADIATNVTDIGTNTTNIGTNTAGITQNSLDIAQNTADIATNVTAIGTNATDIAANVTAIGTNTSHRSTVSGNPHFVNKAEVGLGDADNTPDADKPISTLTQIALDLKSGIGLDVADSVGAPDVATLETKVNDLLGSLRAAGVIA